MVGAKAESRDEPWTNRVGASVTVVDTCSTIQRLFGT
jgi:hypothetical protein